MVKYLIKTEAEIELSDEAGRYKATVLGVEGHGDSPGKATAELANNLVAVGCDPKKTLITSEDSFT